MASIIVIGNGLGFPLAKREMSLRIGAVGTPLVPEGKGSLLECDRLSLVRVGGSVPEGSTRSCELS